MKLTSCHVFKFHKNGFTICALFHLLHHCLLVCFYEYLIGCGEVDLLECLPAWNTIHCRYGQTGKINSVVWCIYHKNDFLIAINAFPFHILLQFLDWI